ncbi:MAG: hypothetical protein ACREVE_01535 [Gammaproteobacteria bacterium]
MGAFFLIRKDPRIPDIKLAAERLSAQLTRQGFSQPRLLSTTAYDLYVYPKLIAPSGNVYEARNGDFCCCTGTLLYRGEFGNRALELFYRHFDPLAPHIENLYGAFCIVIRKSGRTFLFIDRLGIYKVYRDTDGFFWSSSFLAILAGAKCVRINGQAVYEYVFQGATYGDDTVIEQIKQVDCDYIYELGARIERSPMPGRLTEDMISDEPIETHLERNLANLRYFYRQIVSGFGDRIDSALSGGYDSRLTLALLKEAGAKPKIHVYGRAEDADVQIARQIDAGEGLGLQHIDKSRFSRIPVDEFGQVVEENFYAFDGYPNDGIFCGVADLNTRRDRCRNGELMLNGGGGEIFRNFFYLRNTSFKIRELLWSFYSQFDPGICTRRFSLADYYARLGAVIKRVLRIDRDTLHRGEIELLYPLFRCRYWMGRNNSVNNRLGYALTPFIDYRIVRDAVKIPLRYKNFGLFETRMIQAVDSTLAAYPSAYGHDFAQDPPLKRKIKDLKTHFRPTWSRPLIYRMGARRRLMNHSCLLSQPYRDAVLGPDYEYMREFFRIEAINDSEQLNRICTFEFLFSRVRPDVS